MADTIPDGNGKCRLVRNRGIYWLAIPHPARCDVETPRGDSVVALDLGTRTFLTYFSEPACGKLGNRAFGRVQLLCYWLDGLISRTDTETETDRRRRRNIRNAQARIQERITNLVDELHWQCAR